MQKQLILLLICVIPVLGYTQEGYYLEIVKKEPIVKKKKNHKWGKATYPLSNYDRKIVAWSTEWLDSEKGVADSMFIVFPNRKRFDVEPVPGVFISDKAELIVKFGQKGLRPKTTARLLIFYDFDGNIIKRYENKHTDMRGAMSENGYSFIVSSLYAKNDENKYMFLYNSSGKEIQRKNIGNERIEKETISQNGNYIVYSYSDIPFSPLNPIWHKAKILNRKLETICSFTDKGGVQDFLFSENNDFLAISSSQFTSIVDLKKEKILWKTDKSYITGNYSTLLIPSKNLFLIFSNNRKETKISILDIKTGIEISSFNFPYEKTKVYNPMTLVNDSLLKVIGRNDVYFLEIKQQ